MYDLFSSLPLPIILEMLLLKIYFSGIGAVLQAALSRQAFCGDNGVVSWSLSFASQRNRAPYHRRTSEQTMAADNGSARSTTMDFVVFSLIRAGTRIVRLDGAFLSALGYSR